MTGPTIGLPERLPSRSSDPGKSSGRNGAGDKPGGFHVALSRFGDGGGAKGRQPDAPSDAHAPGTGRWSTIMPAGTSGDLNAAKDQDRTDGAVAEDMPEGQAPTAVEPSLESMDPSSLIVPGGDPGTGAATARALEQLAAAFAGLDPAAAVKAAGTSNSRAAASESDATRAAFGKGTIAAMRFVLANAEDLRGSQPAGANGAISVAGSVGEAIAVTAPATATADGTFGIAETVAGADKGPAGLSPVLPGAVTPAQAPSLTVLRQETHLPPVAQVAERVVEMLDAAAGRPSAPKDATRILELQLRPADLGTVRISLRLNDGRLEVDLRTERAETGQMLDKDRPRLAKALADAGYQTDSLAVSSIGERPHVRVAAGPQLPMSLSGDFGAAVGDGAASGGGAAGDGNAPGARSAPDGSESRSVDDVERIDDGEAHDRDGLYL